MTMLQKSASEMTSQNVVTTFEFDAGITWEQRTGDILVSTSASTENATTFDLTSLNSKLATLASYFVPIFFSIIICVGLIGNCLVITVITKIYKLHGQRLNNTNRFILNLAVSDLLFLIFCVPFHATVYALNVWLFGGFICIFTRFCEEMMKIASVYTLVALSVDRLLAVVYATSARQVRTRLNAIRGLVFIWTAATGIATPVIFTRVYHPDFKGKSLCLQGSKSWTKWYELCITLFGYVLPLLIIICCYVALLCTMCKSAKNSSIIVSSSSNRSRRKVTRIVVLVVIVFAVCWMPHHIVSLWIQFDPQFNFMSNLTLAFRLVAHCMAYANSCLNPLVYAFVSKKFRQDFKKAFTCQYLSDAVGSVKEFSRRVANTARQPWKERSADSRLKCREDASPERLSRARGGTSHTILKSHDFCPRSPLKPRCAVREEAALMLSEQKSIYHPKSTQISSLTIHNCEEDLLIEEDGCAFDDDSPKRTAAV